MSGARDELLARIRTAVAPGADDGVRRAAVAARLAAPPRGPAPARPGDAAECFRAAAEKAGASVAVLADWSEIPGEAARFLAAANLPARLRLADDPRLSALVWPAPLETAVHRGAPVASEDPALTVARAGIAETGSVVFTAGPDTPPSLNLLPETHLVALPASALAESADDVWDTLRAAGVPRSLCLVTGPSRTGDIEMNLVTGVHGPRRVHILLIAGAGQ
jgi:L-lactate dehydrogenase complex protein LldG